MKQKRACESVIGLLEEVEDLTSPVFLKAVRGMNLQGGSQARRKWLYHADTARIFLRSTHLPFSPHPFETGYRHPAGTEGDER
ncbi:MAG TPA: hypothetical protein VFQ30_07155 [Ktedonobacteraceae bacterium]|nr:hypothetical protein [Ktedonobacteraceae bacterium]